MWNKIEANDETGTLENYPMRDEDVVFLVGSEFHTGWFTNDIDYEQPDYSDFGFYHSDGACFVETEMVIVWCYKSDLIEGIL